MWFLNSTPDNIDFKIFVESFGKGYQQTSLQFCINKTSGENTHIMVMPFPYSADKPNGSFKVIQDDRFEKILQENIEKKHLADFNEILQENTQKKHLSESDIVLYENVKQLKKSQDKRLLDFPTIREIWDIYLEEDYGVFTAEIKEGVVYRIDYTHKISILSSLFVQIRYSNMHLLKCKNFSTDIWVSNARKAFIPKFLKVVDHNIKGEVSLDRYSVNEKYDWGEDVRFMTNCWESSDESEDSSELSP